MKRFFVSAAAALYVLLLMTTVPVTVFAENTAKGFDGDVSSCGVYDHKGILNLDQQIELNQLVQEKSEELGLYIMIYLSDTARSEWETKDFADCTYEDYFNPDTDGVFYYMDLSYSIIFLLRESLYTERILKRESELFCSSLRSMLRNPDFLTIIMIPTREHILIIGTDRCMWERKSLFR